MTDDVHLASDTIDRYLAGAASAADCARLKRTVGEQEGEALARLRHGFAQRAAFAAPSVEAAWGTWTQQHDRANADHAVVRRGARRSLTPSFFDRSWTTAQVFGATASIAVLALSVGVAVSRTATRSVQQYGTLAGERRVVTLHDGTIVRLAAATNVRVVIGSKRDGTTVSVQGAATFAVPRATRTPFIVQTATSRVRVLGTTFSVRQYSTESETRVLVTSGRVGVHAVRSDTHSHVSSYAVLDAGALGVVTDSGTIRVIPNMTADELLEQSAEELVFANRSLRDVVAELRRTYAADIRVSDSALARQHITWTVRPRVHTLDAVLDELPLMVDARIVRRNGVVLVVPGRRQRRDTVPARQSFHPETTYGR
jgi:ferric-dicitrate binding protein FerR (iron transport regulator)